MNTMRLGRNDLCRCGSGKKFKKCCLNRTSQPATIPTYYNPPPSKRRNVTTASIPLNAALQEAWDDVPEYVFVRDKGWTHKSKLKPGDSCKGEDGTWVPFRLDLVTGTPCVFVKDKGWIPEGELKPGDQYQQDGKWVTFQPERVIEATPEHPFYVKGKGWTPLGEIKEGDLLRTEDGWVPVTGVGDTGQWKPVYNLRVADYHTYFVGTPEWGFAVWAHNTCYVAQLGKDGKWYIHEVIDGKVATEPLQGLNFADKVAADAHITQNGSVGVMEKVLDQHPSGTPFTDFRVHGGEGEGFAASLNHAGDTLSLDWQGGVGNLKPRLAQIKELAGDAAVNKIQTVKGYATDNLLEIIEGRVPGQTFSTDRWSEGLNKTLGGTWKTTVTKEGGKTWITATRTAP